MRWKNIGISKKIGCGIGSIILLLCILGTLAYTGVGGILKDAGQVIDGNKLDSLIAQKEVDHLRWANSVNALFTDESVTTLNVQIDDHQCGFGKWLYGDSRPEAENLVPDLKPLLKKIEAPHQRLHASARAIGESFKQADVNLPAFLLAKEIEHLNWATRIRDSLLNNNATLTVQTDPTKCALGKWLGQDDAKEAYANGSKGFKQIWDSMTSNHDKLHKSTINVNAALARDTEALRVFNTTTRPLLMATRKDLKGLQKEAISDLAGMEMAGKIFTTQTRPALESVGELLGEIRKTIRANLMTDEQMLSRGEKSQATLLFISLAAIGLGILLTMVISRAISRPLIKSSKFVEILAAGDLTAWVDIDQSDEIGILSDAMNTMSQNLRDMLLDISRSVQTLTSSSTELSAVSNQITSNTEQSSGLSRSVAAAAEEMSTSMNNVAAASEQATTNIHRIVSAVEEMTATIQEISKNTAQGSSITLDAVQQAQDISKKMAGLGCAAKEINKVTETIADISEQTNLLALNATIEAARAGEAGKGFAVVADEIKTLAQQTAEATSEIDSKISNVQITTEESMVAIESIVKVINEIDTITTTVATAIEEQSSTTQEISNNVSQAAIGVQEINTNVNQSSSVAGEVTRDISTVSQSVSEISTGSQQVNESARELSRLAEGLNEMVGQFKV